MIDLRPMTERDAAEIRTWPVYSQRFEQMDYALRHGGWLDEFRNKYNTHIYLAVSEEQTVGFSLLSVTANGESEFRIAVHPQHTGVGFGRAITLATLQTGFRELNMERIYLIVRQNNHPAMKLYESLGFKRTGESTHAIQGQPIRFYDMDIDRETFGNLKAEETK